MVSNHLYVSNAIKSHLRVSLKLDTFDALMQVSLSGMELENMDQRIVFELWCNIRNQRFFNLD